MMISQVRKPAGAFITCPAGFPPARMRACALACTAPVLGPLVAAHVCAPRCLPARAPCTPPLAPHASLHPTTFAARIVLVQRG